MTKKVQPPSDHDVFPPPDAEPEKPRAVPPPPPSKLPASLEVTGVELQTAPSHVLLVKLVGDVVDLVGLKQAIQRALPTDTGSTAPVPGELQTALEKHL